MFHFSQPWMLLLLLLIPLLVWRLRRQYRAALPHPGLHLFSLLPTGGGWLRRNGSLLLKVLSLVLMILALSGPRWPDLRTRLRTDGIAVMLAVDVSGSMGTADFDWNGTPISRLEAVQRVFAIFVAGSNPDEPLPDGSIQRFEGRPTDLIGLVTFASRPETICPLTLGHSAVLRLLEQETPRIIPGESETNISDALVVALARLKAAKPGRKVLVLLTDGEHNVNPTVSRWTPRQVAQLAASLGIAIYTIDAGSDKPTADPAGRKQAVETLKDLASMTGGEYFQASDTRELVRTCRKIDRLERSSIESFQYRRYHEGYPWLALGALVLFVAALMLERTIWRRVP